VSVAAVALGLAAVAQGVRCAEAGEPVLRPVEARFVLPREGYVLGEPVVVEFVARLDAMLDDPHMQVREAAVRTLANAGHRKSLAKIYQAKDDAEVFVRGTVA
jgi:HEAT repeat protein